MAAVVVALIAILLAPVSPPSGSCADVFIIGARGSGQPAGFGAQAEPVVEAIEEGLRGSGLIVESAPLDYPAISISESFGLVLLNGGYDRSVRAGAIELISELAGISSDCPRSEVVLVGYSQGAQAIKSALEDLPPRHRIAAVVLLADPTRDPAQAGIVRLGDPSGEGGGSFGPVELRDHFRAVTIDVCAEGDSVCDRARSSLVAHVEGYGEAPEWVMPWIEAELVDGLRTSSGPR